MGQIADPPAMAAPEPPLSPPAAVNPLPASLVAIITPLGKDDMTSGGVIFIQAGDNLSVIGRIGGMAPNRRYEMVLLPVATPATDLTAASRVTGAEPPPPGMGLGMLTSDANGAAIWDATLRKNDLAKFPEGIAGCTVVIKRAPPLDTPGERRAVASGQVVAIPAAAPAP